MTVATLTRKTAPMVGDGVNTSWDFSFKVNGASDIRLVKANIDTGVETNIPVGDFDVALNPTLEGGLVLYPKPGSAIAKVASNETIVVYREVEQTQDVAIKKVASWDSIVIERELDRLTMRDQELQEQVNRCLKQDISTEKTFDEYIDGVYNTYDEMVVKGDEIIDECEEIKADTQILLDAAGLPSDLTGQSGNILVVKSTEDGYDFSSQPSLLQLVPVGAILPFYDFNGTVTFSSSFFAYCDGSVVDDESSPLNTLTLPDMSNRYLVGFGTEAGGNIGTAAWSATPVGNANHIINIQHNHDMTHRHSFAHTHTQTDSTGSCRSGGSSPGYHSFSVLDDNSGWGTGKLTTSLGTSSEGQHRHDLGGSTGGVSTTYGSGSINPTTTAAKPDTGSSLSTTQSIQPRSVSVRYIIRYK